MTNPNYCKNHFEELAGPIHSFAVENIQINLGTYCNQSCRHCHLAASPLSEEIMSWEVMEKILSVLRHSNFKNVELTGGAPELNPHFSMFVEELCSLGLAVKVRTNLSALLEPGMEGMAAFLREKKIPLSASLPCYLGENVEAQRGEGSFSKSIASLQMLNKLGYGTDDGPELELVFNPGGASLPGSQKELEQAYHTELFQRYEIVFTRLLVLANMPVGRFRNELHSKGTLDQYMDLLRYSFNENVLSDLMCRRQISIDWNGVLYDCDFNLALGWPTATTSNLVENLTEAEIVKRMIVTGEHCLGCTAGAGSSCQGALDKTNC